MSLHGGIPAAIEADVRHGERLEWWTLLWIGSVVVVMALVMGASQAMKSAVIEDMLSLIPAIVFLLSVHWERKRANPRFPFGYRRANSLAFLVAATALLSVGGFLVYESVTTLVRQEHPTVGGITLFGHTIWLGWLMMAALVYSVIPPLVLGRIKLPVAKRINDKVLHTDALMQKADWQTGLAAIAGITGIGLGWWWADASAALFIALSIIKDAVGALEQAVAELLDGTPRALDSNELADDAQALIAALKARFGDVEVRLRETGRYIAAEVDCRPPATIPTGAELMGDKAWRLASLSFRPE
ncbi:MULTISPECIES: cation diffusion facilitator family transporter [unclassified Sphingopyxis]|uniref:cation diffusion facilitator family transporter n=1 Tax=unclassified Sphingopyxis TaxID=2614943 RepID=UPI000736F064|nr:MULTISPECIES: cation diffusion facilitator family transporter [unclassified Sphingopyxis]KTE34050.1 cobalt transporter [Sphingopyxis sp. HIX]KTE74449.1 cobalt transporter [Sphingopyxis sp. HXXIV]